LGAVLRGRPLSHGGPIERERQLEPAPEAGEVSEGSQDVELIQLDDERRQRERWELLWDFYARLERDERAKFDARWLEEH
jgi:hypothetical protein